MRKAKRLYPFSRSERGQSIVLIAGAFIGLVAFLGLAIDTGILFVGYGHLRRATDAAALAAAQQMRTQYTSQAQLDTLLDKSATEFLRLNNYDLTGLTAKVLTCTGLGVHNDPTLCSTGANPKRKLVKVEASGHVDFVFMGIIGLHDVTITASSEGEAASLDVVLVVDISESMTYDCNMAGNGTCKDENGNDLPTPNYRDPSQCNVADPTGSSDAPADPTPGECHPFEEVKQSAKSLARFILDKPKALEEDRLSIVVFSNGWEGHAGNTDPRGTYILQTATGDGWTDDVDEAVSLINGLQVYTPSHKCSSTQVTHWSDMTNDPNSVYAGPCLWYTDVTKPETFQGMTACPTTNAFQNVNPAYVFNDTSTCGTTNLGGGLKLGALQFGSNARSESLWIEIILTDGLPNATCNDSPSSSSLCPPVVNASGVTLDSNTSGTTLKSFLPINFCPDPVNTTSWAAFGTKHKPCISDLPTDIHGLSSADFNAMDYARIAALFAACDPVTPSAGCNSGLAGKKGQGAILFSIGLGKEVAYRNSTHQGDNSSPPFGDYILRYIANVGDDGDPDPATDPCSPSIVPYPDFNNPVSYNCGNYFYASSGSQLSAVFDKIKTRIFTRISK